MDARTLGRMVDRTHRELAPEEIARLAGTYHAWRGEKDAGAYEDVPGFCKSAPLDEIRKHGHVLTPGRYVGAEAQEREAVRPASSTCTWRTTVCCGRSRSSASHR